MAKIPEKWDIETDVVVLGTGASGLVAAICAHDEGAKVTILEKAGTIGGATAVSGGFPWIPNNHLEKEIGIADSREEALTYMKFIADGQVDDELVEAFIDNAPVMIKYIEDKKAFDAPSAAQQKEGQKFIRRAKILRGFFKYLMTYS